jgi:hypothetical protein
MMLWRQMSFGQVLRLFLVMLDAMGRLRPARWPGAAAMHEGGARHVVREAFRHMAGFG